MSVELNLLAKSLCSDVNKPTVCEGSKVGPLFSTDLLYGPSQFILSKKYFYSHDYLETDLLLSVRNLYIKIFVFL